MAIQCNLLILPARFKSDSVAGFPEPAISKIYPAFAKGKAIISRWFEVIITLVYFKSFGLYIGTVIILILNHLSF